MNCTSQCLQNPSTKVFSFPSWSVADRADLLLVFRFKHPFKELSFETPPWRIARSSSSTLPSHQASRADTFHPPSRVLMMPSFDNIHPGIDAIVSKFSAVASRSGAASTTATDPQILAGSRWKDVSCPDQSFHRRFPGGLAEFARSQITQLAPGRDAFAHGVEHAEFSSVFGTDIVVGGHLKISMS